MILKAMKQEFERVLPAMRKIAAYADSEPAFGEEWAWKFSQMICDIEDRMLAEQGEDGDVIPFTSAD